MASAGPNNGGDVQELGSNAAWNNLANAVGSDNSYADVAMANGIQSNTLKVTQFGFAIGAGDTIDNILVEVESKSDDAAVIFFAVSLIKAGAISGNDLSGGAAAGPAESYKQFTGSPATWGVSVVGADINNAGFGAAIVFKNNGGGGGDKTGFIDNVRITITYTPGGQPTIKRIQTVPFLGGSSRQSIF